jgi:hypothetical protein
VQPHVLAAPRRKVAASIANGDLHDGSPQVQVHIQYTLGFFLEPFFGASFTTVNVPKRLPVRSTARAVQLVDSPLSKWSTRIVISFLHVGRSHEQLHNQRVFPLRVVDACSTAVRLPKTRPVMSVCNITTPDGKHHEWYWRYVTTARR